MWISSRHSICNTEKQQKLMERNSSVVLVASQLENIYVSNVIYNHPPYKASEITDSIPSLGK